jgi:hypothetical protein
MRFVIFYIFGSLRKISIPAYAIEQQWWQSDVSKNEMSLMSLIFKNDTRSLVMRVTMWLYFKNYWHASKWSSICFSHWQWPSNGDFSFPRFIGILILSLWFLSYEIGVQYKDFSNQSALGPCGEYGPLSLCGDSNSLMMRFFKWFKLFIPQFFFLKEKYINHKSFITYKPS